ncbi:phosphatidic acid phosphatase [Trypanosoma grayi]|uniref:phosphatidic acid phosphatase n=1 Tax=Trypanosoma grayi TaxID=71804 RepID=UPI0004F4922D|nr:phosphatidic acid phosphatase [Trypanosoma grayi]KEG15092.1 phosphatidic acid phosphatase [Trypanosoma grayi]
MHFVWKWRLPDYLTSAILLTIGAFVGSYVQPYCRPVSFSDSSIMHQKKEDETVPIFAVIIAIVLTVLLYTCGELYLGGKHGRKKAMYLINSWFAVHMFSFSLEFCIVALIKVYAGRLRPDFIALLEDENITEATIGSFTEEYVCRAAREGRLSFPSGHSSSAFSGIVPPAMYLLGLTRTFRNGRLCLAFISLLPLIFSFVTAVSRTRDNDHHFSDILAGAIIGSACGVFAVLIAFVPSPTGEWAVRGGTPSGFDANSPDAELMENPVSVGGAAIPETTSVFIAQRREDSQEAHKR